MTGPRSDEVRLSELRDRPTGDLAPASQRIAQLTARVHELEAELRTASKQLLRAEQANAELLALRARLDQAQHDLAELEGSRQSLVTQLAASEHARERAEHWLEAINRSVSWRVTGPLRILKRWARRARA